MNDTTQTAPAAAPERPVLLQPDNHNKKYEALFVEIDSGQIKLPMFQREFVWEKEQSAKLIDSILKGFPIGTFIFWKTKDELRSYKEVGNHKLPETDKGDYVQYILDGQQRITSLYAIRKGIRITKDGKVVDYCDIFINLDYDPETDEQIVVTEKTNGKSYVSVHDVLSKPLGTFYRTLSQSQADQVELYKNKLTNYDFSTITIKDYPIEVACEVFSRINTGGKTLSVFEVMVAKTYDEVKGFDLAEKYELLRDGSDEEKACLTAAKFETLAGSFIMQCVAAITLRAVRSKDILKIRRETFIDNWEPMKTALFMAIDFIRSELRVPVSQLVPYPALVVPLTYFFHVTGNKKPSPEQVRLLEQFFYWAGLTERYNSGTESKLSEDFNKMDAIAKSVSPVYSSSEISISPQQIAETWFSAGNGYCKAILCLLAYQQPKSFDTNGLVILDNSNLKIATSRNYHHFFPKAYLDSVDKSKQPNLIANITLIDGYSNKHRIGKKPPSEYTGKFAKANEALAETLQTHLIRDVGGYGVNTDDYTLFIQRRSKAIALALNVKLMSMTPTQALEAEQVV
ncbi:DUF262 domain-containing protein [Polaromonas sp. YR568]|uniref:GmrSD restriction endonuclease domain-containing protein n=1 Tax=Polaromonas sp. YR568 TaxID=1855301 RepID=UPI0031377EBD